LLPLRYSVLAPKLFNELGKKDPKKCANDVLLQVGMDKDHFRTGHTKVGGWQGQVEALSDSKYEFIISVFFVFLTVFPLLKQ
jgi:hypothetical protein